MQSIAELERALQFVTKGDRVEALLKLAALYMDSDLQKTQEHIKNARKLARKLKLKNEEAEADRLNAEVFFITGKYRKALELLNNSLAIYRTTKDLDGISNTLLGLGRNHWKLNDYEASIKVYFEALEIIKGQKDQALQAEIMNNLSLIYILIEDYETAREYLKKVINIWKNRKNDQGLFFALLNLGLIAFKQDDMDQANAMISQALDLAEKIGKSEYVAAASNNMGLFLIKENKYEKALDLFLGFVDLLKKNERAVWVYADLLNNIATCYLSLNDLSEAKEFMNKSLAIAREIDSKDLVVRNLDIIVRLALEQENYKSAYEAKNELTELRSRLYEKEVAARIAEVRLRSKVDRKKRKARMSKDYGRASDSVLEKRINEIIEDNDQYQLMIESSEDLFTLHDKKGKYLYCNRPFLFSLKTEDLIGKSPYNFYKFEYADLLVRQIKKAFNSGKSGQVYTVMEVEKEEKDLSHYIYPVSDNDGNILAVGMISRYETESVIEQKDSKPEIDNETLDQLKALQEKQHYWKSFQEDVRKFVTFRVELHDDQPVKQKVVFFSSSLKDILGINVADDFAKWFLNIHEDERDLLIESFNSSVDNCEYLNSHFRIFHPELKTYRWINLILDPVANKSKKVIYFNGLVTDITDLKQKEADIISNLEHLKEKPSLLQVSSQPFILTDLGGDILEFNPAFAELSGFKQDNITELNWISDMTNSESLEIQDETIKLLSNSESPRTYEKIMLGFKGKKLLLEVTAHPLFDEKKQLEKIFYLLTDIAEDKKYIDSLQTSRDDLNDLLSSIPSLLFSLDNKGVILQIIPTTVSDELGFSSDLENKKIKDNLPADAVEKIMTSVQACLEKKEIVPLVFKLEDKNCWLQGSAQFINENKALISVIDISNQKEIQQELIQAGKQNSKLFLESPNPLFTLDKNLQFINFNPAMLDLLGYTSEEIKIIAFSDLNFASKADAEVVNKLLAGEELDSFEYQLKTKSGELVTLLQTSSLIGKSDHTMIYNALINITSYKTEQTKIQNEYTIIESELEQKKKELDKKSNALEHKAAELYQKKNELEQKSLEIEEKAGNFEQIKKELDERASAMEQEEALIEQEKGELRQKSSAFQQDADKLELIKKELDERATVLKKEASEMDQKRSGLEEQAEELKQESSKLGERKKELEDRSNQLGKEAAELYQKKNELAHITNEFEQESSNSEEIKKELDERANKLEKEAAELEKKKNQLELKSQEFTQGSGNLEKISKDLEEKSEKLKIESAELEQKKGELEQSSKEFKQKTEDVEFMKLELEERATELEQNAQEIETRSDELKKRSVELEKEADEIELKKLELDEKFSLSEQNQLGLTQRSDQLEQKTEELEQIKKELLSELTHHQSLVKNSGDLALFRLAYKDDKIEVVLAGNNLKKMFKINDAKAFSDWFTHVVTDDQKKPEDLLLEAIKANTGLDQTFNLEAQKNGKQIILQIKMIPAKGSADNTTYFNGYLSDITETAVTETAMLDKLTYTESVVNMLHASSLPYAYSSRDKKLLKVNSAFCKLTGYSEKELLKTSSWQDLLTPTDWWEAEDKCIEDAESTFTPQYLTKDLLCKKGKPIQVEQHINPDPDKKTENLHLFIYDITEKMSKISQLKNTGEEFTSILHNLPELILDLDYKGKILSVINKAVYDMFPEHEDLNNETIYNFYPGKFADTILAAVQKTLQSKTAQHLYVDLENTDHTLWFDINLFYKNEDSVTFIAREMTEKIILEKDLEKITRQFKNSIEDSLTPFISLDKDLKFTYANQAAMDLLQITSDELADGMIADFDTGSGNLMQELQSVLEGESINNHELEVLNTNGDLMNILSFCYPLSSDVKGDTVINCFWIDITDRKLNEIELIQNKDNLEREIDNSVKELQQDLINYQAFFQKNKKYGLFRASSQKGSDKISLFIQNPELVSFFNSEKTDDLETLLQKIVPEDRDKLLKEIKTKINKDIEQTLRISSEKEPEKWLRIYLQISVDKDNGTLAINGLVHDISEHVLKELELQKHVESMSQTEQILYDSEQPFAVITPEREIVNFNPAFLNLIGYDTSDLENLNWDDLIKSAEAMEKENEVLKRILSKGTAERYESEISRKDGTDVALEINVHPGQEDETGVKQLYLFLNDISSEKQMISSLENTGSELLELLKKIPGSVLEVKKDGTVTKIVSANLLTDLGFPADLEGRKFDDIFPTRIAQNLRSVIRNSKKLQFTYNYNDITYWLEAEATGVDSSILLCLNDITVRKELEEELQKNNTAHEKDIATQKQEFNVKLKEMKEQLQKDISEHEKDADSEKQGLKVKIKELETQLQDNITAHEKDIEIQKQEFNAKLKEMDEQLQNDISEHEKDADSEKQELKIKIKELEEQLQSNFTDHKKDIDLRKQEFDSKIKEMEEQLLNNTSDHEKDLDAQKQKFDSKLKEMEEQLQKDVSERDKGAEIKSQELKAKITELEDELLNNIAKHEKDIETQKQDFDGKFKEMEEQLQKDVSERAEGADLKKQELETRITELEDELITNISDHEKDVETQKQEFNTKLKEMEEQLQKNVSESNEDADLKKQELDAKIAELEDELLSSLSDHERDIDTQEQEFNTRLKEMETDLYKAAEFAVFRMELDDLDTQKHELILKSPSLKTILNINKADHFSDLLQNLDPDNQERIKRSNIEAVKTGNVFDEIFNLKNDTDTWIRMIFEPQKSISDKKFANGIILDVSDLKNKEPVSVQQNSDTDTIISNTPAAIYSYTPDFSLTFISSELQKMTGISEREKLVKWTDLFSASDLNKTAYDISRNTLKSGKAGEILDMELFHRNGSLIPVEVREAPVIQGGEVISMVGTVTDIGSNAKTRSDLKFMTSAIKAVDQPILITDHDLNIIFCNQKSLTMFGASSLEDLMDKPLSAFMEKGNKDDLKKTFNFGLQENARWEGELKLQKLDKNPLIKKVAVTIFKGWNEDADFLAIVFKEILDTIDLVKELKSVKKELEQRFEAEKELLEDQKKLGETIQLSKMGTLEWDIITDEIKCSDGFFEIMSLKRPQEGLDIDIEFFRDFIHPDSEPEFTELVQQVKQGKKEFDLNLKMLDAKDKVKYLIFKGRTYFADNEPANLMAIITDVTSFKPLTSDAAEEGDFPKISASSSAPVVDLSKQVITLLLEDKPDFSSKNKNSLMLKELMERGEVISVILQQVMVSKDQSTVNFQKYLQNLSQMIGSKIGNKKLVSMRINAKGINLPLEKAVPCGLIVHELIVNCIKHAFPEGRKSFFENEIKVDASEDKGKFLLTVSDNGIGLNPEFSFEDKGSSGLRLVKFWAERQLMGNVNIDLLQKNGVSIKISF